jgi:hypothetical protein
MEIAEPTRGLLPPANETLPVVGAMIWKSITESARAG